MTASSHAGELGENQLPLPLDEEVGARPEPPAALKAGKPQRKTGSGFVRVTRDPDVARSYSDNVALDYAIARGLAEALTTLPPEDLAALRAKVAQAARHYGKSAARPPR